MNWVTCLYFFISRSLCPYLKWPEGEICTNSPGTNVPLPECTYIVRCTNTMGVFYACKACLCYRRWFRLNSKSYSCKKKCMNALYRSRRWKAQSNSFIEKALPKFISLQFLHFTFFIFLIAIHSYEANTKGLVTKALSDTLVEPVTSNEVSWSTHKSFIQMKWSLYTSDLTVEYITSEVHSFISSSRRLFNWISHTGRMLYLLSLYLSFLWKDMRRHMRTCDEPFTTASVREKIKNF
jgi:hypothetical protein